MTGIRSLRRLLAPLAVSTALAGCAGGGDHGVAVRCEGGLSAGYRDLDLAKAQGYGGTEDWSTAATLLAAAKIDQQFGSHPNCVDKVDQAKQYLRRSRGAR